MLHKFPYEWTLKDANFTKDKGTVFSCFACGGGSTMGYKLAGFDVIGCNEIDPKMIEAYKVNHNPKYSFLEPIQTFKNKKDFPDELYNLDILDGSPPCSSFSMAGNREKDWGKEKKFREGQAKQVLDNLFFDFIDLAKELQPKVVVAENVKGILMGKAMGYKTNYVRDIYKAFDKAGYYCQHWLLDASKMGVPQRRERVFFICLRKDLAKPFLYQKDVFTKVPELILKFNEKEIKYETIEDKLDLIEKDKTTKSYQLFVKTKEGDSFSKSDLKSHFFGFSKVTINKVCNTIVSNSGTAQFHYNIFRQLNKKELLKIGTFPNDYNFLDNKVKYLIGMSIPPVMIAQIATEIYNQWLSKINKNTKNENKQKRIKRSFGNSKTWLSK